jgi:hypothetical protein
VSRDAHYGQSAHDAHCEQFGSGVELPCTDPLAPRIIASDVMSKGHGRPVTVYLDEEIEQRVNRHRIPNTPGARIPSFSEVLRAAAKRGLDESERERAEDASAA